MSDTSLPISRKDVRIELVVDGVPTKIVDAITKFSANAMFETIESKYLGTTNVDVDTIPEGWRGDIEVNRKNGALDDMIDAYILARKNLIPVLLMIVEQVVYRDGTSATHVYVDVKIPDFGSDVGSSGAVTTKFSWRSGTDRI